MATYSPGGNVIVEATFKDNTGTLVTPSPVSVVVTDPTGAAVTVGAITFPTVGNGQAQTSVVTTLGDYQVTWTGTISGFTVTNEYQFSIRNAGFTAADPLAVAVMVAYCGWDPTQLVTGQTVALDGNGTPLLVLPCMNVTAVTAVSVTNADGATSTATIGAGMQVNWSTNGCLYWNWAVPIDPLIESSFSGYYWPAGQQNIAVTYSGGYAGPDAFLDAALGSLTNRLPQMGRTSARLGSAGFTYAATVAQGGLLLVEQMVFDRYRLPRVA